MLKNAPIALAIVCLAAAIVYYAHSDEAPKQSNERKVLFWYDPMYPATKFDAPGPSPFMDMDLVPKYADEEEAERGVRINLAQAQNIGLKTQKAYFGNLVYQRVLPANLDYNDHAQVIIQPRSEGFVEKAAGFTVGDRINMGETLALITVPAWIEAQSEYIFLRKSGDERADRVLERLRLLGMSKADLDELSRTLNVRTTFAVQAPISGVITALELREGMNFTKTSVVAKIQSVSPIWIHAFIPQSFASLIDDKSEFSAQIAAFSEQTFALSAIEILPSVNDETKTLTLRAAIDNSDGRLKPSMIATITLKSHGARSLLIPTSAVIDDGNTQRVIVVDDEGRFEPRAIKVLGQSNDLSAIAGIEENESVAHTGVFLIDSEANINGALDRMKSYDR
ncbi:MAG: efflux RND transporter periplasmic adaptor subunit [Helicobacteraceae bacterium]|jgi:Cu(I)/Ag(I) efflux system membrane fusion protein|nr:efflux RND transporter periplasmic adaptor subunit [Helicobacteraceae bacterium]